MALQQTPGPDESRVMPLRIERGAVAEATDGPVGTIEQIVVDRTSGQMSTLVIRSSDDNTEFELPVRYIAFADSTGNHVRLNLSRHDLADNPEIARPYDPDQYTPLYQGEAVPQTVAGRVAAESDRPVVTDVEENAAGLVITGASAEMPAAATAAPATPASTDTAASGRRDVAAKEDTTPTVKLNAAQPSTGEPIVGEQGAAPAPETSTTPATTGALMGGKPSTSGMGEKSYVPTSPAPALDTVPTSSDLPPYANQQQQEEESAEPSAPATPRMEPPTATPVESSAQPASQADVDVNVESEEREGGMPANDAPEPFPAGAQATPESVAPPDPALGSGEVPVLTETVISPIAYAPPLVNMGQTDRTDVTSYPAESGPTTQMTPAQPQMLDQLKERLPGLLASLGRSPALLLAAGGLTAGIAAGMTLRRRDSAGARAQRTAGQVGSQAKATAARTTDQASVTAQQARDVAAQLARGAQDALRSASEAAQAKAREAQAQLPGSGTQLVQQAKEAVAQMKEAAAQTREQAKEQAAQTREQAKATARQAQQQAQRSAKRTARRFRWFRRGLIAGGALGMLFAPRPGSELRSRIGTAVEDWRSRMSRTA